MGNTFGAKGFSPTGSTSAVTATGLLGPHAVVVNHFVPGPLPSPSIMWDREKDWHKVAQDRAPGLRGQRPEIFLW